jgi:dynein heavy chain
LQVGEKQLIIFGGIDKRARFNDVWHFSLEDAAWTQVKAEGPCPEPRGHCSATRVGDRVLIFGGYGGNGQAYNDLWALHIGQAGAPHRWEQLTESVQGTGPVPRFDHSAFVFPVTPNSASYDKLVVMGGRDLSQMYSDSHVLDLHTLAWEEGPAPSLPYQICSNVCDGIEAVPNHKVFSFGGKRGMMQYTNAVEVMDAGSQVWSTPPVDAGEPPCGRWVVRGAAAAAVLAGLAGRRLWPLAWDAGRRPAASAWLTAATAALSCTALLAGCRVRCHATSCWPAAPPPAKPCPALHRHPRLTPHAGRTPPGCLTPGAAA